MGSFGNFSYVSSTFIEFCMENKLPNILKTRNITTLTKVILKSSYRVLQITSKWKTVKQPFYFLRAVEFWSTFDTTFFWKLQNYTFQKTHRSLSKHANIYVSVSLWKVICLQNFAYLFTHKLYTVTYCYIMLNPNSIY